MNSSEKPHRLPEILGTGVEEEIFISYRRKDKATVGRIRTSLITRFGNGCVFLDVLSIPGGADFQDLFLKQAGSCRVFLAIIGEGWSDRAADGSPSRLFDPEDPVRKEIEEALKKKITVIPVLLDAQAMPVDKDLPTSLRSLSSRQYVRIRQDPDFENDMARLMGDIEKVIIPKAQEQGLRFTSSRILGGIALLCLLVGGAAFASRRFLGWGWRTDAELRATVHAEAVDFKVGKDMSGPFVCRCADVSFDRESFSKVVLPSAVHWKAFPAPAAGRSGGAVDTILGGRVTFRNIDFQSLLVTKDTVMKLRWNDHSPDGLLMRLTYPNVSRIAAVTVGWDEKKSSLEFVASLLSGTGTQPQTGALESTSKIEGNIEVYPADASLALSVSPCMPHAAATANSPLTPADNIPLAPDSSIRFITDDGESAILGSDNSLEVENADRKENLVHGQTLTIAHVQDRVSKDSRNMVPIGHSFISVQIKDGILVNILARAGGLAVDAGDARPSLIEYLRAKRILSAWLALSILILISLLIIFSRLKLAKMDNK